MHGGSTTIVTSESRDTNRTRRTLRILKALEYARKETPCWPSPIEWETSSMQTGIKQFLHFCSDLFAYGKSSSISMQFLVAVHFCRIRTLQALPRHQRRDDALRRSLHSSLWACFYCAFRLRRHWCFLAQENLRYMMGFHEQDMSFYPQTDWLIIISISFPMFFLSKAAIRICFGYNWPTKTKQPAATNVLS